MADKEMIEKVTLKDLDIAVVRRENFEILKRTDKRSATSIRACAGNNVNSFSYSKYGLKQAKRWIIYEMEARK